MIAAFGNFQVGIVFRRELDACCGNKVYERVVRLRQMGVYVLHDFIPGVRAGDSQNLRMDLLDEITAALARFGTQATGDDYFAVFRERLADRIERFFNRGIDESTSIHYHQVRPSVVR